MLERLAPSQSADRGRGCISAHSTQPRGCRPSATLLPKLHATSCGPSNRRAIPDIARASIRSRADFDFPRSSVLPRSAEWITSQGRITMSTWTRRQAIKFVGVGTALAGGMMPRSLLAQPRTPLIIGTAGKEGAFYPLGKAMAAVISKYVSEVDAIAPETNGTAENIELLQEGKIELALAQADMAWAASQGQLNGLPGKVAVRNLLGHPRKIPAPRHARGSRHQRRRGSQRQARVDRPGAERDGHQGSSRAGSPWRDAVQARHA